MSKDLKDTGERMIPEYHKRNIIYGEHIVRYQAALPFVKDKIVMDIASGSGYGSYLLARNAKKVIGVDVSQEATNYSKKKYKKSNLEFLTGDGTKIPVDDDSVDVIVSYETIEHIKNYNQFLKEAIRVLKKDGVFIVSTPNDKEFAEGNHFHYHEFDQEELEKLLKAYFSKIKWYYQSSWLYSALLSAESLEKESQAPIDTINASPINKNQSVYFFAVCSNKEIKQKLEPVGAISQVWSAKAAQSDAEQKSLTSQHVKNLTELVNKQKNIIKELQKESHSIKSSRSWRALKKITSPVRKKRKGAG